MLGLRRGRGMRGGRDPAAAPEKAACGASLFHPGPLSSASLGSAQGPGAGGNVSFPPCFPTSST